ncbi:barnase inhibitor [Kribbella antibiotica]|uniref:Barnase inhibitor n=1 Tax=Kribbella antibiotica TaxID=190195 RepID=A0A4R4ZWR7_9ACTN|nr:barstar family protein [Kribbella antibiotica]TDD63010.1 barnase inhibitor [Kribbella antibiotica]
MAVYDREAERSHPLDYCLAVDGFVKLFWSPTVLAKSVAWLDEHGYRIVRAQASNWHIDSDMHNELAVLLDFPEWYGGNLDALNDALFSVSLGDFGLAEEDAGLVLVLDGFDQFLRRNSDLAWALLDIYAARALRAALTGTRMLCLIQSDDAHIDIPDIGAQPIRWNDAEFFEKKRR